MLDEVLGRQPVVRCRVCNKPNATGVHPECQRRAFSYTAKRVTCTLPRTITTQRDRLRLADALCGPVRCPQCGCASTAITKDCPECRPGSSKVPEAQDVGAFEVSVCTGR